MDKANLLRIFILLLILSVGAYLWTNELALVFRQGIGVLMACLLVLWLISLVIKDASIIDIFWGMGFVIVGWFYALKANPGGWESFSQVHKILLGIISIWGIRLSGYLAKRNLGKGEDYRYAQWRKDNGKKWWWLSFFRVFALQGFLLWLISATFLPSFSTNGFLDTWELVGLLFWSVGFFFESVGDWQMMQFKKNPLNKGKVMDKGLWRYTRHPNYFGDAMVWWGFFFFALSHPQGIYYIFCPLIMTFFLLKVSGVAMLEVALKKNKPAYAEYIRKTSSFIPCPPRN